ncbi:MAG: hypothetical protein IPK68_18765 [Bdellovibrionales bacterium]|nr:hypothetical protein [Bdellovibrionales bacterium]
MSLQPNSILNPEIAHLFGHNRITDGLRANRCIKIEIFLLEAFTVICHRRQIIDLWGADQGVNASSAKPGTLLNRFYVVMPPMAVGPRRDSVVSKTQGAWNNNQVGQFMKVRRSKRLFRLIPPILIFFRVSRGDSGA